MPPKQPEPKKPEVQAQKRPGIRISWIFSILILVLIVIAFVLTPIFGAFFGKNSGDLVFGTYDGEPIEYTYNNYFYKQRESIAANWSQQATDQTSQYQQIYQIWKSAYDNTVVHTALLQQADKAGIMITEEAIDRYLLNYGPYIVNGVFSTERYNATSQTQRREYRKEAKESLLIQTVVNDMFGAFTSKNEIDYINSMSAETRMFSYTFLPLTAIQDDQVIKYAQNDTMLFSSVDINVITLSEKDKGKADDVYAKLNSGEILFEDAARTYSIDTFAEEGGYVGKTYFASLQQNFNDVNDLHKIFSLAPNQISELILTPYGYNIYRLNSSPIPPDLTDAETLAFVRDHMISYDRGLVEDQLVIEAQTIIDAAKSESFETAVIGAGLEVYSVGATPINVGNSMMFSSLEYADDKMILSNESSQITTMKALYTLDAGEISDPIIASNGIIIAECTQVQRATEEELSQGREMIEVFYQYLAPQMLQQDYTSLVFGSDLFEDNFLNVFFTQIMGI